MAVVIIKKGCGGNTRIVYGLKEKRHPNQWYGSGDVCFQKTKRTFRLQAESPTHN